MSVFQDIYNVARQWNGSGALELADYALNSSYSPLGQLNSLSWNYERKVDDVERLNTAKRPVLVEENLTIEAELVEVLNTKVFDRIMGTSHKTVTTGTLVTGKTQEVIAIKDKGYQLNYANADGTAPTITSCVNSLAVTYSDYEVTEIDGLFFVSFNTSDTYTLTLSYTPIGSVKYEFGALSEIPFFKARITNKDADGKISRIELYKAANVGNLEMKFKKDTDTDRAATIQLKIKSYYDDLYKLDANGNAQVGSIESPRFQS